MNGLPLNIDITQVLLHMLNFCVLFGILYFLLYKPVKSFMDGRMAHYKQMDDEANAVTAKAELMKADYEKKLADSDALIAERAREAAAKSEQNHEEILRKAKEEADAIVEKARKDAAREHDARLADANREVTNLVASAAKKLVFEDTADVYDAFLQGVRDDDGKER